MKKMLVISILFLAFLSWAQNRRYTSNLFPSATAINNVVYASAPAINGPFFTVESSTADQDLVMDIYQPTSDTFELRPAVILAHSGAFLLGNRNADDVKALCDSLARKGYVTASIDYRKGFNLVGNTELHATRAVYRGIQDGRAAVRFLRANAALYGIDPMKIYFVGSSAGSFIGLHAIYLDETSEIPPQAGVVNYFNITPPFSHTAPNLGPLDVGTNLTFSGKPDAVVAMWGAIQSTNLITASNTTPVLLIHGEADSTVNFNTGSPFGYTALPEADGSNLINLKLDALGFTNKETYFVAGQGHEFYGTTNGTWSNGVGGNAYLSIISNKITQFLWKRHKPLANYEWTSDLLSVTFNDISAGSLAWWWDFGDGTFSNEQNPTHVYSANGTYQVKLYIENEIGSWDENTQSVTVSSLSTAQNIETSFSIFPNPTKGDIQLSWDNNYVVVNYQIYDVVGKLVAEKQMLKRGEPINLSALNNGLYFLKISAENVIQTVKIVKE